jgi:DNA-binding NarL/FixJ family response regulator
MKQRVFVAEDLSRMRGLLIDLFSSTGEFQVVGTACTEQEAERWLARHGDEWDLAIIDLVLDEGDGTHVVKRARQKNYGGLVVVLASCVTENLREHCYALGADSVFDEEETGRFLLWLGKVGADLPAVPGPGVRVQPAVRA